MTRLANVLLLLSGAAFAQAPQPVGSTLMLDLNTAPNGSASSDPEDFLGLGSFVYYSARTVETGRELWRSRANGTGARLVRDGVLGPEGSDPRSITAVAGGFVFSANTVSAGRELWFSNGTTSGTGPIFDLYPGAESGHPSEFVPFGGGALFLAADDVHGRELWTTDGTNGGTRLVADIAPGATSSEPRDLVVLAGVAYFSAVNGDGERELWRSDGTEAGTWQVVDLTPGPQDTHPAGLVVAGSRLYFHASGDRLCVSDGTVAGTSAFTVLPSAHGLTALGDQIVFVVTETTSGPGPFDTISRQNLWRSDGTETGTQELMSFAPPETAASIGSFVPHTLGGGEEVVLFGVVGDEAAAGGLWRTDGTQAGTVLVAEDFMDETLFGIPSYAAATLGDLSLLVGPFGDVWRTDGTAAGTTFLELPVGVVMNQSDLSSASGAFWFRGLKDGDFEPWRSDGTVAGTAQVADIEDYPATLDGVGSVYGGTASFALFRGATAKGGAGLFAVSGGGVGSGVTALEGVEVAVPPASGLYPNDVWVTLGERIVFLGEDAEHGEEIWVTDGAPEGTARLPEILPGPGELSTDELVLHEGLVYFGAYSPESGVELWYTDGETSGLAADVTPGTNGTWPRFFASIGTNLYFAGDESLYVTPGLGKPVRLVTDRLHTPRYFTGVGDDVLFTDATLTHGRELWITDGTEAGTRLLVDLEPGEGSSDPRGLLTLGERVLFRTQLAADAGEARLWTTDGTVAGTEPLLPGDEAPFAYGAVVVHDRAFFAGTKDGIARLYTTDGTPAGTEEVLAFPPDSSLGLPAWVGGDVVVFAARTPELGTEVWRSDGTAEGTYPITEIVPGAVDFPSIGDFHRVGDLLLFRADDHLHGDEWHAVRYSMVGE